MDKFLCITMKGVYLIRCSIVLFCAHLLSKYEVVTITDKKEFYKILIKYKVIELIFKKLHNTFFFKKKS